MRKVLVLASGGLDSSVLVALYKNLGYEVHTLYIRYGNLNEKAEIRKLNLLEQKFGIPMANTYDLRLDFSFSKSGCLEKDSNNNYVEMRNLIFISHALSLAEAKGIQEVAVGFINLPNGYPDTSEEFVVALNNLAVSLSGIEVRAPLHQLPKEEVYRLGVKLGIALSDTFSCNRSNVEPCGECADCMDIKKLIRECNVPDEENPFKN